MRLNHLLLLVPLAASCAGPPASRSGLEQSAYEDRLRASLILGTRSLDDPEWSIVDDQTTLGLELDWQGRGLGWEFSAFHSSNDEDNDTFGVRASGETNEYSFGARKAFAPGRGGAMPYFGLGLSYLEGDLQYTPDTGLATGEDSGWGIYAQMGIRWQMENSTYFGMAYRRLFGVEELGLSGGDVDIDYHMVAATIGLAF